MRWLNRLLREQENDAQKAEAAIVEAKERRALADRLAYDAMEAMRRRRTP